MPQPGETSGSENELIINLDAVIDAAAARAHSQKNTAAKASSASAISALDPQSVPPGFLRIKDSVFRSMEVSEREAQRELGDRELVIRGEVVEDAQSSVEEVAVPVTSVVAIIAGAELAHQWKDLHETARREEFRRNRTRELIRECLESGFDTKSLEMNPLVSSALRVFFEDFMNESDEATGIMRTGLPPAVLQSTGSFTVERNPVCREQVVLIMRSILHRLHQLCGDERNQVRTEIAGWQRWKHRLVVPTETDIPQLRRVYDAVRIPFEGYKDLCARQPEIREAALDRIRKYGGFIHSSNEDDYREMLEHGVVRMTDSGTAYYGVITDNKNVEEHLKQMCGFDPDKAYEEVEDLPKTSANGWELEWNVDPGCALSMFQHPHQVAVSVEVAVEDDTNGGKQSGAVKGRRNAGVAAALKESVYRDPRVEQAWVLTRHFQLVEVGIPNQNQKKFGSDQSISDEQLIRECRRELVSGALNLPSDAFIRLLGGREIGSGKETCVIEVPDKNNVLQTVVLVIRWIFCLAPRKVSIDMIEGRGQRM